MPRAHPPEAFPFTTMTSLRTFAFLAQQVWDEQKRAERLNPSNPDYTRAWQLQELYEREQSRQADQLTLF